MPWTPEVSDGLTAWLLLLLAGATVEPLAVRALGWKGPAESRDPDPPRSPRPPRRRKLRLAGALLVLMTGLSFPPANCVQKATAAEGLAPDRPCVRTWSRPASERGGPCPTRPCP